MVLAPLEAWWTIPAALAACGLVFLGDAAAESGPRHHNLETFVLNFFALPIGGATLVLGALEAYAAGRFSLTTGAAIGIGAILAGRSLREIPWTGVASLLVSAATGYYLVGHSPWTLSLPVLLGICGLVFVIVFGLLYLIELPLRLAGLLALPRPFLVVLGVAALGLAVFVALPSPL